MNAADKALAARLAQALGSAYTLEGEIGRGGMGVVFNARDERLKRRVAVKVLPPELAFREEIRLRFVREAETAARLSHPHIVPIHSVGEGPDGLVYFVMAYVDGESLGAKLKRRGRRPDVPEDLAACVMRSLEKDPEDRWPTADALRRALEARSATMYQPRRPSLSRAGRPRPPAAREPLPGRQTGSDRAARRLERMRERPQLAPSGEPEIVRELRSRLVTWASVCGSLFMINVATGPHRPSWSLFVAGVWAGTVLLPRVVRLWHAGYSWRDVLARPPAPDAIEARLAAGGRRPVELPRATTDEFGHEAESIQQARSDRKAILRIVDRLPKSERKLLPDIVVTADALLNRAEELARTLQAMSGSVDQGALRRLEEKIDATRRQPEGVERDRQVSLLNRQRQALTDLLTRRQLVADQLESCVLAMQNVRFDLLRLRSAGVAVALDDLTRATQQARALSRDVDHVIAAAGEIKQALGEQPGA